MRCMYILSAWTVWYEYVFMPACMYRCCKRLSKVPQRDGHQEPHVHVHPQHGPTILVADAGSGGLSPLWRSRCAPDPLAPPQARCAHRSPPSCWLEARPLPQNGVPRYRGWSRNTRNLLGFHILVLAHALWPGRMEMGCAESF